MGRGRGFAAEAALGAFGARVAAEARLFERWRGWRRRSALAAAFQFGAWIAADGHGWPPTADSNNSAISATAGR
ncbi:MAG TPA: hypothetical protein VE914_02810, partial [Candidatus Angelobacter sp.]|nr:hypothetical protein [Candidatus Angelobacter sp.]